MKSALLVFYLQFVFFFQVQPCISVGLRTYLRPQYEGKEVSPGPPDLGCVLPGTFYVFGIVFPVVPKGGTRFVDALRCAFIVSKPGSHKQETELLAGHNGVSLLQSIGLLSRRPPPGQHDEPDPRGHDGRRHDAPSNDAAAPTATATTLLARRWWHKSLLRRLRLKDFGQVPAARAGPLLAQFVSEVYVLPSNTCGHWKFVLHQV